VVERRAALRAGGEYGGGHKERRGGRRARTNQGLP
jgi:hypothetical protein